MSKCRSCGAEIRWIELESGRKIPCNASPEPYWSPSPGETRVVVFASTLKRPAFVVQIPDDRALVSILTPHWATCPQADEWRKKP